MQYGPMVCRHLNALMLFVHAYACGLSFKERRREVTTVHIGVLFVRRR